MIEPVLRILILSFSFLAVCTGVFCITVSYGVIMKVRNKYGSKKNKGEGG